MTSSVDLYDYLCLIYYLDTNTVILLALTNILFSTTGSFVVSTSRGRTVFSDVLIILYHLDIFWGGDSQVQEAYHPCSSSYENLAIRN